jgi:hypothetical protein
MNNIKLWNLNRSSGEAFSISAKEFFFILSANFLLVSWFAYFLALMMETILSFEM